jgi:hypothetical protein
MATVDLYGKPERKVARREIDLVVHVEIADV